VYFWCNWGGKDGNYALYGQIDVNSIERMDGNFPQGKDFQSSRPIRRQEFILSEGAAAVEGPPLSYGCVRRYYTAGRARVKFILMTTKSESILLI